MKNSIKEFKPYVNFLEFDKNRKVKKAWNFLTQVILFREVPKKVSDACNKLNWEEWETAIVEGFKLTGRDKALFLGHSYRWKGTDLT